MLTTDGQNIQSFFTNAWKIVRAVRLHANNLLRSADKLENSVIDFARLLRTDRTNIKYNDELKIIESQWKANLKHLTENIDKCAKVVDNLSQLQQLDLKKISTCIDTSHEKGAMTRKTTGSQDLGKVS